MANKKVFRAFVVPSEGQNKMARRKRASSHTFFLSNVNLLLHLTVQDDTSKIGKSQGKTNNFSNNEYQQFSGCIHGYRRSKKKVGA